MNDTYEKPPHGWTCFHCGETFMTIGGARDHFGHTIFAQPGCQIKLQFGDERGLLMQLRKLEIELDQLRRDMTEETTDIHRAMYSQQAAHAKALIREEEKGYTRGLIDGRDFKDDINSLVPQIK